MEFGSGPDWGYRIKAWLLPDNPSRDPVLRAELDGIAFLVSPNVQIDSLIEQGRTNSGWCGFDIDEKIIPGLSQAVDVRLIDEYTGLTIFVRRKKRRRYVDSRIFMFEARPASASVCNAVFGPGFVMAQPGAEMMTQETRASYIHNIAQMTTSILLSGATCVRGDEPLLRAKDYHMAALLADPAQLLFEALMPPGSPHDSQSLARFTRELARLSEAERNAMMDPLTRCLANVEFDDELRRDAVAQALSTLAECEAVGVEAALPEFVDLVSALCDADPSLFGPAEPEPPFPLAAALRQDPALRALIGRDLEIYDAVADAILETRNADAATLALPAPAAQRRW